MKQSQALQVLKSGKNVFLTGEPGAGKTYTINQFVKSLSEQGIRPDVTASTGIASTHINGMTIHSWTGMGIKSKLTDQEIENILNKGRVMRRIAQSDILIIDEISMLDAQKMEDINRILCFARGGILNDKPFGGIQVVLVGDFFQLPPVSKEGPALMAFESSIWESLDLQVCYLTEQHRQEDQKFTDILTHLRKGTLTTKDKDLLRACKRPVPRGEYITRIFTHNQEVDHENYTKLQQLKTPAKEYKMSSSGIPYLVAKLKENCLSPELLTLKVGALVMFTQNKFDGDGGEATHVNGTVGTVIGYDDDTDFPIVETKDGRKINVRRSEWTMMEKGVEVASVKQLPMRLAWAMTVHKSQGMSLDAAVINLGKSFEHGQGYVALSRVRSLAGLYLENINAKAFEMHPKVVIKDEIFRKQSEELTAKLEEHEKNK